MRHWVIGLATYRHRVFFFAHSDTGEGYFRNMQQVSNPVVYAEECDSKQAAIELADWYSFKEGRANLLRVNGER